MEKLYERIDFRNNTTPALNEDNLNAISRALDEIDDRVIKIAPQDILLQLKNINKQIEETKRLAEEAKNSEESARLSAENAATSENKAKISELRAERYAVLTQTRLEKTNFELDTIIEKAELNIKETVEKDSMYLADSSENKIVQLSLYGKATQEGIPTNNTPVDVEVAGSNGNITINSVNSNFLLNTASNQSVNGIDMTIKDDGSFVLNGTSTGLASFTINSDIKLKVGESYKLIFDGNIMDESTDVVYQLKENDKVIVRAESSNIFTCKKDKIYSLIIKVGKGKTLNNYIVKPMICFESNTDCVYEKSKGTSAFIPVPNGLAGIPVDNGGNYTDENGQQWISDEIIKYTDGTGEYVQRIKKRVFDGINDVCSWVNPSLITNTGNLIQMNLGTAVTWEDYYKSELKVLSDKATFFNFNTNDTCFKHGIRRGDTGVCVYYIGIEEGVIDVATANTWLQANPVTVYYIVNPIKTPLTAEQISEIEKLKTFNPITNIFNNDGCGMRIEYITDAKLYIDNKFAALEKILIDNVQGE